MKPLWQRKRVRKTNNIYDRNRENTEKSCEWRKNAKNDREEK